MRAEPDDADAELLQIVELRGNAGQVADSVAIRVLEGARVDLVDHSFFPPLGFVAVDEVGCSCGGRCCRLRGGLLRRVAGQQHQRESYENPISEGRLHSAGTPFRKALAYCNQRRVSEPCDRPLVVGKDPSCCMRTIVAMSTSRGYGVSGRMSCTSQRRMPLR